MGHAHGQVAPSVEAANEASDSKGKGVDRPNAQLAAAIDPTAMSQMAGYPAASHYAVGTPMESAYYSQPNFMPQMTNENFGSEYVQPYYPNSGSSAVGDSQFSHQWGWQGYY